MSPCIVSAHYSIRVSRASNRGVTFIRILYNLHANIMCTVHTAHTLCQASSYGLRFAMYVVGQMAKCLHSFCDIFAFSWNFAHIWVVLNGKNCSASKQIDSNLPLRENVAFSVSQINWRKKRKTSAHRRIVVPCELECRRSSSHTHSRMSLSCHPWHSLIIIIFYRTKRQQISHRNSLSFSPSIDAIAVAVAVAVENIFSCSFPRFVCRMSSHTRHIWHLKSKRNFL